MVSLQTESGNRVQASFMPSSSLWDILEHFEQTSVTDPAIVYMRQQVVGREQLLATSLKALGMSSGRVSLRLISLKPVDENTTSKRGVPMEQEKATPLVPEEQEDKTIVSNEGEGSTVEMEEEVKRKPIGDCYHDNIEFPVLPFSIFPSESAAPKPIKRCADEYASYGEMEEEGLPLPRVQQQIEDGITIIL